MLKITDSRLRLFSRYSDPVGTQSSLYHKARPLETTIMTATGNQAVATTCNGRNYHCDPEAQILTARDSVRSGWNFVLSMGEEPFEERGWERPRGWLGIRAWIQSQAVYGLGFVDIDLLIPAL
uniref:Uncharacterized protein n=1 Tax=Cannabis sativa TaxID=3483 RepID=A0A803NUS8_CANSA